ncbi:hypothetical protein ACUNV4_06775 [Granulosicoccus sp. 3-233]|uniref:hypothetical protein n=1 Tax=Granulosicoccus sp. 3-233 TaxID=3417969 RepID=UPI003D33D515
MSKTVISYTTSLLLAASLTAVTAVAQAQESDAVDEDKVEEVVQESQESGDAEEGDALQAEDGAEPGEASYNVADCEALIDDAEESDEEESADAGAEQLDLDKCRQLIK